MPVCSCSRVLNIELLAWRQHSRPCFPFASHLQIAEVVVWADIDPLGKTLSEVRVSATVHHNRTSRIYCVADGHFSSRCSQPSQKQQQESRRSSNVWSDCTDLSGRLLNIESDMPDLPFKHVLTCTCPLEPFAELLRCSARPSHREKTTVFKEAAGPWRCTTKPDFIDELCVSKLSGQQEFTETLKSLSAITGIFFNHYHSSETACPVLKLIQVLSVCRPSQHIVDSRWVTDPRWFI